MPTFVTRLCATACALIVCAASVAQTPIPAAPTINATSYLVQDHFSGKIIAQKNASERLPPASITKLMTAYATFKKLREGSITLADKVSISQRAYKAEGSRMFVEINSKVKLEDLIQGMIVQSGNDASIAIAEHIGGTEEVFVNLMNYFASELGMTDTQFANSTGLPAEGHFSTAADIAKVSNAIIREFPEYYRWYSQREYTYNNIPQYNRNTLLAIDDSVDGMKTGRTDEAGYCLVASALRGQMRLVSVVMGTPSKRVRADASQALLNYAFNFYETHRLYSAGEAVATPRIWKADADAIRIGLLEDLFVTIPKGQYSHLNATMDLQQPLTAPVAAGSPVGSVTVNLMEQVIANPQVVALESVGEGGFFQRMSDAVLLWFE
ncbi:MAG: D-alanyl-D-alanine carboxypeptidase [Gammaproteobacteria bacterium]|nr:D-alanyl-D-alanine carboxypeptidase [Gammaproteobacteria bacterium]